MSAPNLKEIEWAIYDLKHNESSPKKYIILAALYICRDHMLGDSQPEPRIAAYAEAPAPVAHLDQYGDSDFLQSITGKDPAEVLGVMNELMDTLLLIRPKVYDSVMGKLEKI